MHIQDSHFYVLCDTFYCFRILCDNGVLEVLSVSYTLLWELLPVVRNYGKTVHALHGRDRVILQDATQPKEQFLYNKFIIVINQSGNWQGVLLTTMPYFPAHKTHSDFFVRNFRKK